MKKIFSILAAACALVACDPVSEDITNNSSITADQLKSMSTVAVSGNEVTCNTSAPVNAVWNIGGKTFLGNYAWKKMKKGDFTVTLTGLCANGNVVTADYPITITEITNPLEKFWIYGEDPVAQPAFTPGAWDAAQMRFSDNEGKHFPYLSDDVYWGFKTLVFELTDVSSDCTVMIHNGWWSNTYFDNINLYNEIGGKANGLWEFTLTEDIAKDCARGNGGGGKDLQLLIKSGTATFNSVYYEE